MASSRRKWSGSLKRSSDTAEAEGARKSDHVGQQRYAHALRSWAPGYPSANRLEQSQHQLGAIHVAIKLLSDQAAACDVAVKRRKTGSAVSEGEDDSEAVPHTHDLARLLRRPNNKEAGGMMRRRWVQQFCLTGDVLTWRLDDGDGMPAELWCIPTGTWMPMARGVAYPEGAFRVIPYFAYGPFTSIPGFMNPGGIVIPAEETMRFQYPHPLLQYDSYSTLTACAKQLDSLEAVEDSRLHGMKARTHPSATIELDGNVNDPDEAEIDRFREMYHQKFSGPSNAGRVPVLKPGMSLRPWNAGATEIGWENSWSQLVDFVLSCFGCTKTLAFMGEAGSYAALYASLKQFNLLSLTPLLQIISECINVQLVWPYWGEDYFVELTPRSVDDEDLDERRLATDHGVGLRTVNEERVLRGLEPMDWGEVRAYPGNWMEQQQAAAQPPAAPPPGMEHPPLEPAEAGAAREEPGDLGEGSLPGMAVAGGGKAWRRNGRH